MKIKLSKFVKSPVFFGIPILFSVLISNYAYQTPDQDKLKYIKEVYKNKVLNYTDKYKGNKYESLTNSDLINKAINGNINESSFLFPGNTNFGPGKKQVFLGMPPVDENFSLEAIEITRRGLKILPDLIKKVNDKSKTTIFIRTGFTKYLGGIGVGASYADLSDRFYFTNPENELLMKGKVNTKMEDRGPEHAPVEDDPEGQPAYYFKTGDMCFNFIGQILNRNYKTIQYYGKNILIITPVYNKNIYEAVILECKNITQQEHENELIKKCLSSNQEDIFDNLLRLHFYYEKTARKIFLT